MLTLEEIFPPFALRITCGPVELRVLRDADLPELVELVRGGIDEPGLPTPFLHNWHHTAYAPGIQDGFPATSLGWWWTQRAMFASDNWRLALTVRRDGELVGMQDVHAEQFAHLRTMETGSWLGTAHHRRGTGTLMRQMVVGFAFDELGARMCESSYVAGNLASAGVSRKTGYVENGRKQVLQRTADTLTGVDTQHVRVTPETYVRPVDPIVVEGAEELRKFLEIER